MYIYLFLSPTVLYCFLTGKKYSFFSRPYRLFICDVTNVILNYYIYLFLKGQKLPRIASNGNRLPDPLPHGSILTDVMKRKWKLGKSIGVGGFGEIYLGMIFSYLNLIFALLYHNLTKFFEKCVILSIFFSFCHWYHKMFITVHLFAV